MSATAYHHELIMELLRLVTQMDEHVRAVHGCTATCCSTHRTTLLGQLCLINEQLNHLNAEAGQLRPMVTHHNPGLLHQLEICNAFKQLHLEVEPDQLSRDIESYHGANHRPDKL